jgi:hypothetical protein
MPKCDCADRPRAARVCSACRASEEQRLSVSLERKSCRITDRMRSNINPVTAGSPHNLQKPAVAWFPAVRRESQQVARRSIRHLRFCEQSGARAVRWLLCAGASAGRRHSRRVGRRVAVAVSQSRSPSSCSRLAGARRVARVPPMESSSGIHFPSRVSSHRRQLFEQLARPAQGPRRFHHLLDSRIVRTYRRHLWRAIHRATSATSSAARAPGGLRAGTRCVSAAEIVAAISVRRSRAISPGRPGFPFVRRWLPNERVRSSSGYTTATRPRRRMTAAVETFSCGRTCATTLRGGAAEPAHCI